MQLLRNHFYLLITRLHFYSSVNETSHNFVDSRISSAGCTSVIHLRIVFECFTFTKEKLSIVIVYLTIFGASRRLLLWFVSIKIELNERSWGAEQTEAPTLWGSSTNWRQINRSGLLCTAGRMNAVFKMRADDTFSDCLGPLFCSL